MSIPFLLPDYTSIGYNSFGYLLFLHKETDIIFVLTPADEYDMGFSDDNNNALKQLTDFPHISPLEMQPVIKCSVPSLLVSITPVLNCHISYIKNQNPYSPAYLNYEDANNFAIKLGCRLPYEFEWEYLYRAGSQKLFPFGNHLIDDDSLACFVNPNFSNLSEGLANSFGLYGMCSPEWCTDIFRINLLKDSAILDGSRVIRGGGAFFWPWQDEEWIWLICSMRSPASALYDDSACFRLVKEIHL